jgi:hypothetical protein
MVMFPFSLLRAREGASFSFKQGAIQNVFSLLRSLIKAGAGISHNGPKMEFGRVSARGSGLQQFAIL